MKRFNSAEAFNSVRMRLVAHIRVANEALLIPLGDGVQPHCVIRSSKPSMWSCLHHGLEADRDTINAHGPPSALTSSSASSHPWMASTLVTNNTIDSNAETSHR